MAPLDWAASGTSSGSVAANFSSGRGTRLQPPWSRAKATISVSRTVDEDRFRKCVALPGAVMCRSRLSAAAVPAEGAGLEVAVEVLQHLIVGLDGLGVHLVSALRFDHVHHFLHDVDVGGFHGPLLQG